VAWRLLFNEDYPSWLYPVRHGATTIWERWNGWTEQEGFFDPQMNSFNHYSLGSVGEWLFRHAAGIELDQDVNGFKSLVIRPYPDKRLSFLRARYRSIMGTIESGWQWQGDDLVLSVRIPANTQARVYVPSDNGSAVVIDRVDVGYRDLVVPLGREGQFSIFRVLAGSYAFRSMFKG
jgi:alpha-L-rhamnosidase